MKIVIIGPGAMGTLFAARLCHTKKHNIWLLDKNARRAALIKKTGLHAGGLSKITVKPDDLNITANSWKIGTADLIIFFVKSFDTQNAADRIAGCVDKNTIILTLQNGFGNAETIQNILARAKKNPVILAGITSEASTLISPGFIEHTGKGETIFGRYGRRSIEFARIKQIANIFNSAGIKSSITKNVKGFIWSKVILNSAINPIAAITLKKNGELLMDKCLRKLLLLTVNESAAVVRGNGIKIPYKNLFKKAEEICRKTAKNYNSMLQDILKGGKTEINHINGAVIRAAQSGRRLETPLNKMLYCFVKLMEKYYGASSKKTVS